MLPKGWTEYQLGDIAMFKNGLNYTKADAGEVIKIVGVSDFKNRSELENTNDLDSIRVAAKVRDSELLESGDLLFVRSNGNRALIGRCLYFPEVSGRLAYSGFTIRGRVDRAIISPAFASYLMRSKLVMDQIFLGGSGTNISNLSQEILTNISIRIPQLAEQRRIALILSTWDQAIATTERLLANSRKQKQVLSTSLVSARKITRENETSWEQSTLSQVATVAVSSVNKKSEVGERAVQLCNYTDVYYRDCIDGRIDFMRATATNNEIEKFALQQGDVIITKDSETAADIAVAARVTEDMPNLVCGYHLAMVRPDLNRVDPVFLHSYFSLPRTKDYFASKANGVTRFGLPLGAIQDAPIAFPPIGEQRKIGQVISSAEREIAGLVRDLELLKIQKTALQSQLLTGKRRVRLNTEGTSLS